METLLAAMVLSQAKFDRVPLADNAVFGEMASITKTMTAAAILQLAEAGEIDLDAPVQRYLPRFTLSDEAQSPSSRTPTLPRLPQ